MINDILMILEKTLCLQIWILFCFFSHLSFSFFFHFNDSTFFPSLYMLSTSSTEFFSV